MRSTPSNACVRAIAFAFAAASIVNDHGAIGAPPAAQSRPAAAANGDREYAAANGLLSRGLYELAAKEYRSFLEAHPDHPKAASARYGLGVALHRSGKREEALASLAAIQPASNFEFAAETLFLTGQIDVELNRDDA